MNNEIKNKQNRKVTIFALFLSLVSVGVLVFGFLLVSSNKVILLQSISNIYNKINVFQDNNIPLLDKISDSKNNGIKSLINVKSDKNMLNISFNYAENASDSLSRLDLAVKYFDDEIINGNVVLKGNKVFFFLKGITENYLYTNFNYQSFIKSLKTSEYNKLFEYVKDAIDETIKNDSIKKEKVTVKYNGKDKRVNKLTYKIGYQELKKMFDTFTKSLKSDKELYKNLATYLDLDTKELDSALDEISKVIPDEDKKIIEYNVYYYGFNKIFRYDLKLIDSNVVLSYQENTNDCVINLSVSDKKIVELVVKENKDNNNYELTVINPGDDKTYTVSGSYDKDKLVANYDDNTATISKTTSEKDNNYITNSAIIISDKNNDSITIDISNTYYFDKKIKFKTSNTKNLDRLSEEDMNLIINNFKESKLFELISSNEELSDRLLPKDILIEE